MIILLGQQSLEKAPASIHFFLDYYFYHMPLSLKPPSLFQDPGNLYYMHTLFYYQSAFYPVNSIGSVRRKVEAKEQISTGSSDFLTLINSVVPPHCHCLGSPMNSCN